MSMNLLAIQEKLRAQANPLSNVQWITEQMDSISRMGAVAKQMECFTATRLLQEQAEKLYLGSGINHLLGQSAVSGMLKTITENRSYLPTLSLFDQHVDSLLSITNKLDISSGTLQAQSAWNHIDSQLERLHQNEAFGHVSLAQKLRHQFLDDLSMNHLTPPLSTLSGIQAARASVESLLEGLRNFDWDAIGPVDNDSYDQVATQIEIISANAVQQHDLHAAVAQIIEAVENQKQPEVRFSLTLYFSRIFLWFIKNTANLVLVIMLTPSLNTYISTLDGFQSPQEIKKNIKAIAHKSSPHDQLENLRYVNATTLNVRLNPRAQAPKIGELNFGNVVNILKKDKDFTLVEWTGQDSEVKIQGWVFSRYLNKFNR